MRTEAPPAVTMSEAVLAQVLVRDNTEQDTGNAEGDYSPEQMDQTVLTRDAHGTVADAPEELVLAQA